MTTNLINDIKQTNNNKYQELTQSQQTTLALAGIFQAATLVNQIANTNIVSTEAEHIMLSSLFVLDPKETLAVYHYCPERLALGLKNLLEFLTASTSKNNHDLHNIVSYVFALIYLERKFIKDKAMTNKLRNSLKACKEHQLSSFAITNPNILSNLASMYTDTIGTFSFKINIIGQHKFLGQRIVVNKLRALLLTGIRSAVLWRQLGGSRWNLFINKRRLLQDCKFLISINSRV